MQTITNTTRPDHSVAITRALLWCGPISTLWYIAVNIYVPMQDSGYAWISQTVSELSAIDAPTRALWNALLWPYSILLIAFGLGIWRAGHRFIGGALILQGVLNPFWPPMHLRPVLAAGGGDLSDQLHIAFTGAWGLISMTVIVVAAVKLGGWFRFYSVLTLATLLGFGYLTTTEVPNMQANLATPLIGLWERINMAAFMVWALVLGLTLIARLGIKSADRLWLHNRGHVPR